MKPEALLRKFGRDLMAIDYRPSMAFAMTCLVLIVAFALGGSSRADVPALLFLRPAATVMLGYGLWTLRPAHIAAHRFLFAFAVAALAIPLLHLVRLPETMWAGMPGHGLLAEIDRSAGFAKIGNSRFNPCASNPAVCLGRMRSTFGSICDAGT